MKKTTFVISVILAMFSISANVERRDDVNLKLIEQLLSFREENLVASMQKLECRLSSRDSLVRLNKLTRFYVFKQKSNNTIKFSFEYRCKTANSFRKPIILGELEKTILLFEITNRPSSTFESFRATLSKDINYTLLADHDKDVAFIKKINGSIIYFSAERKPYIENKQQFISASRIDSVEFYRYQTH